MKILWFTWKDMKNPYAGGAEVVNEQLAKRLVADGHEVTFLVRTKQSGAHQFTVRPEDGDSSPSQALIDADVESAWDVGSYRYGERDDLLDLWHPASA